MIDIKELFYGRTPIERGLLEYGFEKCEGGFYLSRPIVGGQFSLNVKVSGGKVEAEVYDNDAESRYFLFAVDGAEGPFVGEVRAEYESVLGEISERCFTRADIYREKAAKALIGYARGKYSSPPEYLWHDENCIMRRRDNGKWYLLFMRVERSRLGLEGEGKAEIANMRAPKEDIPSLLNGKGFLPAYHMNKKSWFTVLLDGSVNAEILCALADISYNLAAKKGKG